MPAGRLTHDEGGEHRPWAVLTVLCVAFFMVLLDTTIVNIAVPRLTTDLSATLGQVLWIVNAYTLAYAALLITGGRLGDLFGPKRLFLAGLAVFTVGSALCGAAQTPGQLIATRVLQGVGGALLTPQTLAIITLVFPPRRRGSAFGIWGAVAGVATIAGPTFGGWLVTALDWRWIFYVNVPIGIAVAGFAVAVLPDLRPQRRGRLDWLGTLLLTAGLVSVCFGLIDGPSHGWQRTPLTLAAGFVALGLFAWRQRGTHQMIEDHNFVVMCGVVAAISFGMLGLFLPLVIFLQSVLLLTPLQAGLVLAPMSLASVVSAPVAGRLADRGAGLDMLVVGLVLWGGGVALVWWATRLHFDQTQLIAGLVVAGLGLGMTFAPLQSIATRNVDPSMAGAAAGVMNTARQFGAVLGSVAVGTLLQIQLSARLAESAARNADALPMSLRQRVLEGFEKASTSKGLEVGAGQTGGHLPDSIPASVRPAIEEVAFKTFYEAYIPAMRATLILPVIVLALAVIGAFFVRPSREEIVRASREEPE